MYAAPATTTGLASRAGAGLPLITGGCQCHTWLAEPAFDVVNAVALLTELCCGPCRYWGQSRCGAARVGLAVRAPAAPAAGASTAPARPNAAISGITGHCWLNRNIANPSRFRPGGRGRSPATRITGLRLADDLLRGRYAQPACLRNGDLARAELVLIEHRGNDRRRRHREAQQVLRRVDDLEDPAGCQDLPRGQAQLVRDGRDLRVHRRLGELVLEHDRRRVVGRRARCQLHRITGEVIEAVATPAATPPAASITTAPARASRTGLARRDLDMGLFLRSGA